MTTASAQTSPLAYPAVRRGVTALFTVLVVHGAVAALSLSHLPEIMPVHFDAAGRPDGWSSATPGNWFTLWLVSAGFGLAIVLGALSVFRLPPRLMSLPRKDEFLALPRERRERVLAAMAFHVLVIGGTVMLTLLCIQAGLILVASETIATFPVAVVFASLGLVLIETVVMIAGISSGIRREIAAHVKGKPA
jgi:uncharacterized membrane protein